jgi:hypothetical protein
VTGKHVNRKGAVIDTRFDNGGALVADLSMFLMNILLKRGFSFSL